MVIAYIQRNTYLSSGPAIPASSEITTPEFSILTENSFALHHHSPLRPHARRLFPLQIPSFSNFREMWHARRGMKINPRTASASASSQYCCSRGKKDGWCAALILHGHVSALSWRNGEFPRLFNTSAKWSVMKLWETHSTRKAEIEACAWQKRERERRHSRRRRGGDPLFPDYCRCCVYVPFPSLWPGKKEAEICLAGRKERERRRMRMGRGKSQ